MRVKTAMAVSVFAIGSAQAQAQSNVTVYGLMDNSIEYLTNASADNSSKVRPTSGGMNTSRWGLRGSEDLGGGLKIIFQLESEVDLNEPTTAPLFSRQNNVGFEGEFGRVVFGRSYSTTYDFVLPFDPMGYAPLYSWATSGNATPAVSNGAVRKDGMLTGVSNLIKYQGQFSGFKIGATLGMGESTSGFAPGAKYGFGLSYATGPLSLVATVDRQNGSVAGNGEYDKTTALHLGAAYKISDVKLLGGYRNYKKSLAAGGDALRSDLFWAGATYDLTPQWNLTGAVYHQNLKNVADDADPTLFVLRAKYAFSKRTSLYATAGYAKAKNGLSVGLSRDDAGFGNSQTGVAIGIQHRF